MSRIKDWMMHQEEIAWDNYAQHRDEEKLVQELCECGWHEFEAKEAVAEELALEAMVK